MKSWILNEVNGHKGQLEDWSQINWRKVSKLIRNLQRRLFRARKLGQWKQLRRLQKLLLKSYANLLNSVRQITQVNTGKHTAGIDKEVINTPSQRVKLVKEWVMPTAKPTKRVYIPKANGKKRPLGIPTVRERVAQNIVKTYLEPEWEAVFEPHSYGFRPGRSCHDAIGQTFNKLSNSGSGGHKWVLDADIKGCFDNLAHESILKALGTAPRADLIEKWMKAGFVYKGILTPTNEGTPQGGVCSPLLSNIGLHGLESLVKSINSKLGIIRYADDFIITAKSKDEMVATLPEVRSWLADRGLELSTEKTRVVQIEQGFDFLGFNVRQYKGKLLLKPQKEKVLIFCQKIGEIVKEYATAKQESLIKKLNPILRGFANYYQGVVSKKTFSYINHRVWQYLWKWSKRRHPHKGKRWVKNRYFRTIKGVSWQFSCEIKGRRGNSSLLTLFDIAKHPIIRHIKIRGTASPFDPELKDYWLERSKKLGRKRWAKGSKYYLVAENQKWQCPTCGNALLNGEEIETHHIEPVNQGGSDDTENLIHLHKACHKQVHGKSKLKA